MKKRTMIQKYNNGVATKTDLKALEKRIRQASKGDLKALEERIDRRYASKADIISFKDEIIHEIKGLREEVTIVIGYKDQIEDHETRLETVEKRLNIPQ